MNKNQEVTQMESKIHELIVPLSERLIKQLTASLENTKAEVNLLSLECLIAKLLAEFALELLSGVLLILFDESKKSSVYFCSECQKRIYLQGYLRRNVISLFGRFSYRRSFYYCRECHKSHFPFDERMGVGKRECSPRLERVVAFLSSHLSFSTVEKALAECYELELSDEAIREVSEGVGEECQGWEEAEQIKFEAADSQRRSQKEKAKTFVIEVDGKLVGFQDGSWQEVKVGVIYDLEDRVETSEGRHELIRREIVARRCGWEEFAKLFWSAMQRTGIREGDRIVAVADGAHSMEQIFSFVAPEATRVRDFYHVAERIHAIGEVRFGSETKESKAWKEVQVSKLKDGEVGKVVNSIKHLKLDTKQAEETRRQVLGYFQNHQEAMNYKEYKEEGLPIGSGAVEGGCRLIGARTNGCGRRWKEAGCDKIVALRVAVLNDRLNKIRPQPRIELKMAA